VIEGVKTCNRSFFLIEEKEKVEKKEEKNIFFSKK
jgi:hypothetical protein